ncbi:MAG: hypothetical protein IJU40_08440 [Desulfovibrionaceae bacterium]|nr:hypothetical protein [Desulfovibrionaceae bacterium]
MSKLNHDPKVLIDQAFKQFMINRELVARAYILKNLPDLALRVGCRRPLFYGFLALPRSI